MASAGARQLEEEDDVSFWAARQLEEEDDVSFWAASWQSS